MEKKMYVTPQIGVVDIEVKTTLLVDSGVISDDIGYGGIDEEGNLDVD